jgi:hypothetical protein
MAFVLQTTDRKIFVKIFCGAVFDLKKKFCLRHPEPIFDKRKKRLFWFHGCED